VVTEPLTCNVPGERFAGEGQHTRAGSSARSSTAPTSTGVTAEEQAAAQVAALWPAAAPQPGRRARRAAPPPPDMGRIFASGVRQPGRGLPGPRL